MNKKTVSWSVLTILMFSLLSVNFLSSCKDDEPDLSVSETSLQFQSAGGSKEIVVSASNTDWIASVVGDETWLRVSKNGNVAKVTVESLSVASPRKGQIRITATKDAGLNIIVDVNQNGANAYLTVSNTVVNFDANGGSKLIQLQSNTSWDVSGKSSWLTLSQESGDINSEPKVFNISLTANENESNDVRSCKLTFVTSDGSISAEVEIIQAKPNASILVNGLSSTTLKFDYHKGIEYKQTVNITSNISWSINGVPEWLNVSPINGNGNLSVDIYFKEEYHKSDARSVDLIITGEDVSAKIVVEQQGDRVKDCKVILSDFVTLKHEIACKVSFEPNVRTFYIGYMEASQYGKMTESEIIEYAEVLFDRYSIDELDERFYSGMLEWFVDYTNPLKAGTEYVIFSFGYNARKEIGDVTETRVSTISERTQEPKAYIGNCYYTDTNWYVQIASKEPNCWGYYAFLTEESELILAPDVIYAWYINQGIKSGTIEKYTGTGTDALLTIKRGAGASGFGVGVQGYDSNDVLAGELEWDAAYISSSVKRARVTNSSKKGVFYPSSFDGKIIQVGK